MGAGAMLRPLLAGAAVCAPALAAAQTLGQAATPDVPWLRLVVAFLICVSLAVGAALALKARYGVSGQLFSTATRRLRPLERLRLAQNLEAHLLVCDGRELLVVASSHALAVLDHSPPPSEASDEV